MTAPTLVTGATGFVGSAVARVLLARGHALRLMVRAGSDRSGRCSVAPSDVSTDGCRCSPLSAHRLTRSDRRSSSASSALRRGKGRGGVSRMSVCISTGLTQPCRSPPCWPLPRTVCSSPRRPCVTRRTPIDRTAPQQAASARGSSGNVSSQKAASG